MLSEQVGGSHLGHPAGHVVLRGGVQRIRSLPHVPDPGPAGRQQGLAGDRPCQAADAAVQQGSEGAQAAGAWLVQQQPAVAWREAPSACITPERRTSRLGAQLVLVSHPHCNHEAKWEHSGSTMAAC